MNDEASRILVLAREFPLLGIDAHRAREIAEESAKLRAACDAATQRFHAGDPGRFAAMFAAPTLDDLPG